MEIGTRVQVINPPDHYGFLSGAIGTVDRVWNSPNGTLFGVRIDNYNNSKSKYGLFWLNAICFIIFEGETKMYFNYTPATIHFLDGSNTHREYAYALYDATVVAGDTVVVNTGHHGLAIAQVCTVGECDKSLVKYGREIVCKVDLTAFNERKAKAKKIAELEQDMKAKAAEIQVATLYEMLAEKNPGLRAMLDEYKSLTAG